MSLGITLKWTARSHRIGVSGISLIPRGPRRWSRAPSAQLPLFQQWMHASSEAEKPTPAESNTSAKDVPEGSDVDRISRDTNVKPASLAFVKAATGSPGPQKDKNNVVEGVDQTLKDRQPDVQESKATETTPKPSDPFAIDLSQRVVPFRQVVRRRTSSTHTTGKHSYGLPKMKKEEQKAALKKAQDSVLVPAAIEYDNPRATSTSLQRCHQGLTRQLRNDAIQKLKSGNLANWRDILDILRLRTRMVRGPWRVDARKILVTSQLARALLHDVDNTIWDLHEKTRCHVSLHWSEISLDGSAPEIFVQLSGYDAALEHAVQKISQLAARTKEVGGPASNLSDLGIEPGTQERIWHSSVQSDRPQHVKSYTLEQSYRTIPKPEAWTRETLETYVATITRAKMPPRQAYLIYGSALKAAQAALGLLHDAFEEAAASQALSLRAFKLTMRFIEDHCPSYRDHSRVLFNDVTKHLRMDTGVFNIQLSGTAKVKDLNDFEALLKVMVRHGCEPNPETWIHFLEIIENQEVKRHVVKLMHDRGMLIEPTVIQLVAKELAVWDVRDEKNNWTGLTAFLQSQDAKYGRKWATQSSMNRIMLELARMGDFASCIELWHVMAQSHQTKPTVFTLTIAVANARARLDLKACLAFVEAAQQRSIRPDEKVYHELFNLALKLRKPNMMGVVWRYACLDGKASWHMRKRVSRLTTTDGKQPPRKPREADESAAEAEVTLPAIPTFLDPDMVPDLDKVPRDRWGAAIAWRIHGRYNTWRPAVTFHQALEAALEQDRTIHQAVKEAKQFYKERGQPGQAKLRRTVPGYGIILRPKHGPAETELRKTMAMSITHLATPEQIRQDASENPPDTGGEETQ